MTYFDEDFRRDDWDERPPDAKQEEAREVLRAFFDDRREEVFFSRQVEVIHEAQFFHWLTNRALRDLRDEGFLQWEQREMSWGGHISLLWHRNFRYYKRAAAAIVRIVEEYSAPAIGEALGLHGEQMVLEGFARTQFVQEGRDTREYRDRVWSETKQDLDFIFERNGVAYGVEVKNTLGYMDHSELGVKTRLALHLGLRPVFVVRMVPRTWILEVREAGGFVLVLKFQLYPWTHRGMARRVRETLQIPVDAPRRLEDGTMSRFVQWHEKNV